MTLTFAVDHRYATRDGAVIRLVEISRVYPAYPYLVGVLERWGNGQACESIVKMSFCPSGKRTNLKDQHPDDLVREIGGNGAMG